MTIRYRNLRLKYAVDSPIAKAWFLPRYGDGMSVHEPAVTEWLYSWLHPEAVFFDVGANLGFFTVLGAVLCAGPTAAVHAFEIDAQLIGLTERSLCRNRNIGRVYLNAFACTEKMGDVYKYQPRITGNLSTNRLMKEVTNDQWTGSLVRQAVSLSLDEYCDRVGVLPDVIKMDIEGAEALAVTGMLKVLRSARPKMILELHPPEVRSRGCDPEQLVEMIEEAGHYQVGVIESYRAETMRQLPALEPLSSRHLTGSRPVMLVFEPAH